MRYCIKCGSAVEEGNWYCTHCGHSVGDGQDLPAVVSGANRGEPVGETMASSSRAGTSGARMTQPPTWIIALIILVTLVSVGGVTAIAVFGDREQWVDPQVVKPEVEEADDAELGEEDPVSGEEPTGLGTGDEASEDEAIIDGEYILPESSTRYYKFEELERLSDWELWMARNEIYARHGRTFYSEEAQKYFSSKSWYVGLYAPEEYDEKGVPKVFNDYEAVNRARIEQIEAERDSPYA